MSNSHAISRIDWLAQTLAQQLPGIVVIHSFGSFDTPSERADGDIDLGPQADHPLDPTTMFHLAWELTTLAGRNVDLANVIRRSTVMCS
jgi:hypothetical protein